MDMKKFADALRQIADAVEGASTAAPSVTKAATPSAEAVKPTATATKAKAKAAPLKTAAEAEAALRGLAKDYGQPEGLAVLTELGVKALKDVGAKAEKEPDIYTRICAKVEERRAELAAAAEAEDGNDGAEEDPFGG